VIRTPSQTVGPFYTIGLCRRDENELVSPDDPSAVVLHGELFDGEGTPIPDGMIEVWDPVGRRWGRCGTHPVDGRSAGAFSFLVQVPDSVPGEAPHLELYVFARGLLKHQWTRVYFDELDANEADPVIAGLDEADRSRLVAVRDDRGLRFDIHMQGAHETVFFRT
jgi:protocatechuate 3,4-dioxygenase, alpha subunit